MGKRNPITDREIEAWALANGGAVTRSDMPSNDAPPSPSDALIMSEKDFMAKVVAYAKDHSWRTYHTFRSDKSEPGFPDLVLARRAGINSGRLVFAELKSEIGKPTKAQLEWLRELEQCGQEAYLWRPSDWAQIVEILR